MKFWPILVDFTMTSHLLLSNHVTMFANFEKLLISPGFLLNFRKVTKFQIVSSKALRVMEKKPRGVPKDPPPGPNIVKTNSLLQSYFLYSYFYSKSQKCHYSIYKKNTQFRTKLAKPSSLIFRVFRVNGANELFSQNAPFSLRIWA